MVCKTPCLKFIIVMGDKELWKLCYRFLERDGNLPSGDHNIFAHVIVNYNPAPRVTHEKEEFVCEVI
jgi:hypothetical protein